ncbi:hypothetical protein AXG93_4697s1190 [Marchantia polymorpha subsp. ruderalis]|uniref:Uncharacterized protein n=1 Tax=Marchantia polymorpha subsp. ruderalis TaxID=1480154 RepID=A0A176VQA4_MARPO|nr:hypothetical protein AXG93_4697s1190 [Marchantia polymorpha subsp. ruderalis]
MASNARDWWSQKRQLMMGKTECGPCSAAAARFMIPSAKEVALATVDTVLHHERQHSNNTDEEVRLARARECTDGEISDLISADSWTFAAGKIPIPSPHKLIGREFIRFYFCVIESLAQFSSLAIKSHSNSRIHAWHYVLCAGVRAGLEAAVYAVIASSIPTLAATRMIPWAKANLNYTAQALIISSATVATYFVVTEKTILACSREASYARLERDRATAKSS